MIICRSVKSCMRASAVEQRSRATPATACDSTSPDNKGTTKPDLITSLRVTIHRVKEGSRARTIRRMSYQLILKRGIWMLTVATGRLLKSLLQVTIGMNTKEYGTGLKETKLTRL